VAIWVQSRGISQLSWRKMVSPFSVLMTAVLYVHSTASNGLTPSRV